MKFFKFFFYFLLISPVFSFSKYKLPTHHIKNNRNNICLKNDIIVYKKNIVNKINGLSRLIRSHNILPTLFLSFSGGYIVHPSIKSLLKSKPFLSANLITILIMSISMVINDIYDIELDKINNPNRPLVTGEISKNEAIVFTAANIGLIKYISSKFLSTNLQKISDLALFGILIYTPVLKKISFIKNLFCASMVSFSVYYSGLSLEKNILTNYPILFTAIRYIFLGSLTIELLLDINDMEGDKTNNIYTLPVLFDKDKTWYLTTLLVTSNIINILLNTKLTPISLLFIITIVDLYNIKKTNYDKEIISKSVKNTTIPMSIILLYTCLLSSL
jgi:geranylgeranylglycerol-phosphate geranylgeranyltransferase